MKKTNLYIVFVLFLFNNLCYAGDKDNDHKVYPPEILPYIFLSYTYNVFCNEFCSYYEGYENLLPESSNMFIKLNANLDRIDPGISGRLGFIKTSFIVENIKGHYSGYAIPDLNNTKVSKIPFDEMLFVTTPLISFNDRILVIISSISPENTTIISLDKKLGVDIIYDTFSTNNDIYISSIFYVEVMEPDKFLLRGRVKEKYVSYYGRNTRLFILKLDTKMGYDLKEVNENLSTIHRR